jgi:hypothetical protein
MKYTGLVLTILFVSVAGVIRSNAQDYLITTRGDSLTGQLKPLLYGPEKKVQITTDDKKREVYSMFQIRRYRHKDELFEPVKGPDGFAFMKVVKSGYLSLYHYQLPNQVNFDGSYLQRRDGKGMDVPNISFKKAMRNFLQDCEPVSDRIDKGELTKKNLDEIIDLYNRCIDSQTVRHDKVIVAQTEQTKTIGAWDALAQTVNSAADFDGKSNALEMIEDIKGKVARSEKIPNFLIDGLKSVLKDEAFQPALESALKELK